MFLALSGFCLYYPIVRKGEMHQKVDIARFAKRRAKRILPPYYLALVVFILWDALIASRPTHHPISTIPAAMLGHITGEWRNILAHIFMLHNLSPKYITAFDGPFWSLALESQLYLIFPLLVYCFSRLGANKTCLASAMIALTWETGCRIHYGLHPTPFHILSVYWYALPARFFEFTAGMWAALQVARYHNESISTDYCAKWLFLLFPVALAVCIPTERTCIPFRFVAWGAFCACVLVFVNTAKSRRFWSSRLMLPLTNLGIFSYSLYLIHFPLVGFIISQKYKHHIHNGFINLLAVLVSIPLAYVFYMCLERPFMNTKPVFVKPDQLQPG